MRVEPVILVSGDRSAQRSATEWLRNPWQRIQPRWWPFSTLDNGARSRTLRTWFGSPPGLGALGLHREMPPNELTLGRAIEGHGPRTGQIRWPAGIDPAVKDSDRQREVVGLQVTFDVPEWVSRWWEDADRLERARIERAILTGLDVAVDEIRRQTPLIRDGVGPSEFAYGVVACGKVSFTQGQDGPQGPPVSGQALVVGLERPDGSLVNLEASIRVDPDVAVEAAALGLRALTDELSQLGYSAEQPGRDFPRRTWVGRDGAWVVDPLDEYPDLLDDRKTWIDETAILKGEEVVGLDDATLEARRVELSSAFDSLDAAIEARVSRADAYLKEHFWRWARAHEDAHVLDARILAIGPAPELLSASKTPKTRLDAIQRDLDLVDHLWPTYWRDRNTLSVAGEDDERRAELIAIQREQAIREELHAQRDRGADTGLGVGPADRDPASKAPAGAKRIGCGDIHAILERKRRFHHALGVLDEGEGLEKDPARKLKRADVSAPKTLDRIREVIGEPRAQLLAEGIDGLTPWLEDQSEDWVRKRQAELGHPERYLQRGAARLWRLNEAAREQVAGLLQTARAEEERLTGLAAKASRSDRRELGDLAEVERRQVARHEKQLERLQQQAHNLQGDLDDWLTRDGDRVVRAMAYTDEVAVRREFDIVYSAHIAEVDPPDYLQQLIRPRPEASAPELPEWKAIAYEVEYRRLGAQSDLETGDDWHAPTASDIRRLDERIDRRRAERGMEPRAPERAAEAALDAPGLDGP